MPREGKKSAKEKPHSSRYNKPQEAFQVRCPISNVKYDFTSITFIEIELLLN